MTDTWPQTRDLPAPPFSFPTRGPIVGVVDGSDAAPGEVGEFLSMDGFGTYAAYPTATVGTIPMLNMPPGDWDMWVSALFSSDIGGAFFQVPAPLPSRLSNSMAGYMALAAAVGLAGSTTPVEGVIVIGITARGSFAVTTPINFTFRVDQSDNTSLPAGTIQLHMEARRRR